MARKNNDNDNSHSSQSQQELAVLRRTNLANLWQAATLVLSLTCLDLLELLGHLPWCWELARGELRMQHLPVVCDLESIDRLEQLREAIEAVKDPATDHQVLLYISHVCRRPSPETSDDLLAEEKYHGNQCLTAPHSFNAMLHVGGRCVRSALNSQPWELLLQFNSSVAELSVNLSACTESDTDDVVHHLDRRFFIMRDDVERRYVNFLSHHFFV